MRRREFLTLVVAAMGSGALGRTALAQAAVAPGSHHPKRLIDAHCHIFNGDDLPMEGFIKNVIVKNHRDLRAHFGDYPQAFTVMIHALATLIKDAAQDNEIELIDSLDKDFETASRKLKESRRQKDFALMRRFIDKIWDNEFLGDLKGFRNREAAIVAINDLKDLIVEEVYPQFFCCGATQADVQAIERAELARRLLYRSNDVIGRHVRWALLFTHYRFELADVLHESVGKRTLLVTPALIDFSKWIDDEQHNELRRQVDVMERIGKRKHGVRVHGFMAFDPLRQALHEKNNGAEQDSPLALMRTAIEEKGFIGVKLYPPMGFRAGNNVGAGTDFPVHVRKALGETPGRLLDAILDRLYAWCETNRVPIMAHAANSNGAGPGYGKRASPAHWIPVLEKYPGLRVSLAHFGGFEERGNPAQRTNTWEWTIGNFWKRRPDAFLYADLSYFSEIIGAKDERRALIKKDLEAFRQTFEQSAGRLIFGSDFSMIGREEGFHPIDLDAHKAYPDIIADFLKTAGYSDGAIQRIMFDNAVRFLGLDESARAGGTRGRLEAFYARAGLSADWLKEFDRVS